jgi:hypothetical protein
MRKSLRRQRLLLRKLQPRPMMEKLERAIGIEPTTFSLGS